MKNLKIDENAHAIISDIREQLKKRGIENPNLSDAIRELASRKGVVASACPKSHETPYYKCEA